MIETRKEYNDKIKDIKSYYEYLKKEEEERNSRDILKVLKANIFLMLYNLVESTINNSLEEVRKAINEENIRFKDCICLIRALWIEIQHSKFKKDNTLNIVRKIDSINLEVIKFKKKIKHNVSGNLDAKKIREISKEYSIQENKRIKGERLLNIKNNRNKLAHGQVSFSELGRIYTVSDIRKYYKECELFLREYLLCVESYIDKKTFKHRSE